METRPNERLTMKVFAKGQVVIPVVLRNQYGIKTGDQIEFLSTDDGILLKPKSVKEKPGSLTRHLFGIFNKHRTWQADMTPAEIQKATESGFAEGWKDE